MCLHFKGLAAWPEQTEQAEAAAQGHDGKAGELMVRGTAAVATGWR